MNINEQPKMSTGQLADLIVWLNLKKDEITTFCEQSHLTTDAEYGKCDRLQRMLKADGAKRMDHPMFPIWMQLDMKCTAWLKENEEFDEDDE